MVTVAGDTGFNEDTVGWSQNGAWVVDGATALDVTSGWAETSGRWISTEASNRLAQLTHRQDQMGSARETVQAVSRALKDLWRPNIPLPLNGPLLPPVCSLAYAQLDGTGLGLLALGDCVAVHLSAADGVTVVVDKKVVNRERRRTSIRKQTGATGIAELISDRLEYVAGRHGNVLSTHPTALADVESTTAAPQQGDLLLLCTDGFARAVHLPAFGGCWATLAEQASIEGLSAIAEQLRRAERTDPSFTRGEHKTSDDTTALLIRYDHEPRKGDTEGTVVCHETPQSGP